MLFIFINHNLSSYFYRYYCCCCYCPSGAPGHAGDHPGHHHRDLRARHGQGESVSQFFPVNTVGFLCFILSYYWVNFIMRESHWVLCFIVCINITLLLLVGLGEAKQRGTEAAGLAVRRRPLATGAQHRRQHTPGPPALALREEFPLLSRYGVLYIQYTLLKCSLRGGD